MNLVFDIAGKRCVADHVEMRGNTIQAAFPAGAEASLASAFSGAKSVSIMGIPAPVTYSVQDYASSGEAGCTAVFSVNSSAGRVLH
ncbi:hypothetical protein EDD53_0926 [Pacificibacter maritimus]|uniref:Uncharacterized protein n=1 Tax=Pacificibacter maritimus TaxID=762213 RepID=A0A3N4UP37_9RHOB|nr:hypothetical protein [Pacificibacter maritimus]RPE71798.1 hypothetical protein EDD53_0926 [Pacificibacter maritimus]